jgi:hypothetical protein
VEVDEGRRDHAVAVRGSDHDGHYALCFYAGRDADPDPGAERTAGGGKWSAISTKGYKYKDPQRRQRRRHQDHREGWRGREEQGVGEGQGRQPAGLRQHLPIAMGDLPMTVQLRNNSNGLCWGGSFASPKKNQTDQFNAKTPP